MAHERFDSFDVGCDPAEKGIEAVYRSRNERRAEEQPEILPAADCGQDDGDGQDEKKLS